MICKERLSQTKRSKSYRIKTNNTTIDFTKPTLRRSRFEKECYSCLRRKCLTRRQNNSRSKRSKRFWSRLKQSKKEWINLKKLSIRGSWRERIGTESPLEQGDNMVDIVQTQVFAIIDLNQFLMAFMTPYDIYVVFLDVKYLGEKRNDSVISLTISRWVTNAQTDASIINGENLVCLGIRFDIKH